MSGGFDPDTAILMDFRCDQSRGIHFLYVLPFSKDVALVESTMFALQREPDSFFEGAIAQYLSAECGINSFSVTHVEHGGDTAWPLAGKPERLDWHWREWRGNPSVKWLRLCLHPETNRKSGCKSFEAAFGWDASRLASHHPTQDGGFVDG